MTLLPLIHRTTVPALSAVVLSLCPTLSAEPPVTLENYLPPRDNSPDEAFIDSFSYRRAVRFADHAAMDWQSSHNCVTCHTNGLYLASRPAAGPDSPAYREARAFTATFLDGHVRPSEDGRQPRGGIESIVAATAFLAISDIKTQGQLGETTKRAFDHIWEKQDQSGAWVKWAKCHWGPYEVDDHFGATLVALAVGMAKEDEYTQSPQGASGLKKIRRYLERHPPRTLHQVGMTLWASAHLSDLANERTQAEWRNALFAAQKPDGGWVLPEFGDDAWQRSDGKPQSTHSDAYATAFAIHVLSEAEVPREDPRLVKARQWLRTQQRQSGRWFTRSPRRDNKHYISHAATNFALLALAPAAAEHQADQENHPPSNNVKE